MLPETDDDLRARLVALEQRVADLEAQQQRRPRTVARRAVAPKPPRQGWGVRWAEAKSEDVLGKVGIALLLVGVLFLLMYTIDRGLVTAAVRVLGAGVIGGVLLGLGLKLRGTRPVLGRLLTGGGIAAFYGTLWTASLLYPLLPIPVAFLGMALVAALALVLALRENDAALAVVGTLGGLFTPLLLYRDPGQMAPLVAYTSLLLGGAAAVYARKGWTGLLGAMAVGGWGALFVAWVVGIEPFGTASLFDAMAFGTGVVVAFAVTGVLPVVRAVRSGLPADPFFDAWPRLVRPFTLAVVTAPALLVFFQDGAWHWPAAVGGTVALVLALGYGAGARRWRSDRTVFAGLVLAAGGLLVVASGYAFGVDPLDGRMLAVVVASGAAFVTLARQDKQPDLAHVGHAVVLVAVAIHLVHLFWLPSWQTGGLATLGSAAFLRESLGVVLSALALGYVGFRSATPSTARTVYLTAAHLVIVLWVRMGLSPLDNGTFYTTALWGVYGIALVVVGLRLRDDLVRQIGLGTVLATAAKVLLFDLAAVSGLWRVLLFMGLGGLLLLVSYLVPSILRGEPAPDGPIPAPDGPASGENTE